MKCSDLKQGRQVVFNIYSDIFERKIPETGTVLDIYPNRQEVCVHYLEGYKDRHDIIPYEDMLAAYDEASEMMQFGNISGPSVILTVE